MHIKFVKLIIIPAGSRYLYTHDTINCTNPVGGLRMAMAKFFHGNCRVGKANGGNGKTGSGGLWAV